MKYLFFIIFLVSSKAFGQFTSSTKDENNKLLNEKTYRNGYVFFKFSRTFCTLSIEYDVMDWNENADFSSNYQIIGTPELIWLTDCYAIRLLINPNLHGLSRVYLTKIDGNPSVHLFYENNNQITFNGSEVQWYM